MGSSRYSSPLRAIIAALNNFLSHTSISKISSEGTTYSSDAGRWALASRLQGNASVSTISQALKIGACLVES
ncbi:hypothetical protein M404DRAFT_997805 [Pisolithus tinctorius Marx 270]|uniref:Uncharacterized protein n=1 Tax=Pisolithus tinctorius Marx 270 TaxID=870435 RepID=A0A0C3PHW3_PISTI|nr:hypothetical protein M404DRAFT_997805 [Pisolithus tinctorius Marx 270]